MPSSKGKTHSKNQSRLSNSDNFSSPGSLDFEATDESFASSLEQASVKYPSLIQNDPKSCKIWLSEPSIPMLPLPSPLDPLLRRLFLLTNDAGNYFALAMIFPSSKITKNGVLLSSNLSNTMGCPPSGRVIFITMYKLYPKLVLCVIQEKRLVLVYDIQWECFFMVLLVRERLLWLDYEFFSVNGSEVVKQYHGESEQPLCEVFDSASQAAPSVVSGFSHGGEGFSGRWRKWISGCLESTNFSILIKGRPRGKFKASRGVRLGYPLSPFLFNLVVDVLSRLLEKAQENNMIEGIKIRNEGVEISHRQFGDDTIFFLDAAEENWEHLLELLNLFCKISGLSINKAKCSLLGINSNCEKISRLTQSWVYLLWGTREPLNSGMLLWKRWNFASKTGKKTYLSRGGRLILIQAVLSSIPMYYLSSFKILIGGG
ncbi:unnamed protein product [Prunus armeniaca]|uniref:Uncharacterized protein n=1 Tax=Prunus armeniaca TaxID=36596 RepID=A0A6J5VEK5_PRUAR|nr:unnamed protein product [Prunus armeniaca]